MPRFRKREGVTLVLVAMLLTSLLVFAAAAIDFSRMYVVKVQLQNRADATAHAGVVSLAHGQATQGLGFAQNARAQNAVEGSSAVGAGDAIQPGTWDFSNRTFTAAGSWTAAGVNAVRAVATHTSNYTLGRIVPGITTQALTATAIAARGYVGTTSCLKPWAVSYQSMLDAIFGVNAKSVSYNLSSSDIQTLSNGSNPITLLMDNSNPVTGGNIAQVIVDSPWNGNNSYKQAIVGACSSMAIGPGSWISANAGQGPGQTANSVKQLCGYQGNVNQPFTCNVQVKLAVWDSNNGLNGSNLLFHVKYVAVFTITNYSKGTGPGSSDQVTGKFTTMSATGGFTGTPTPLLGGIGMVQ